MKKRADDRHTIRFRRWSRKAYAMFASIGKCVTIGHVKKGIADASLGKQENICAAPHAWSFLVDYAEEREEEEDVGERIGNKPFLSDQLNSLQIVAEAGRYLKLPDMRIICRTGAYKPPARFFLY